MPLIRLSAFEPSIKILFSNGGRGEGAYKWGFLFGSE
jgi:hypothetical protein